MKIISNLPENHICYCYVESKGYYYNNLGLVSKSQMSLNNFFSLIDGDDLVLYFVDTIIDKDTITFNSKEISRIHFNSQYNEIEHVDEKKVSTFIKYTSTDVMLTYMSKILLKQDYYQQLVGKEIFLTESTAKQWFRVFCSNANINIPLLLSEDYSVDSLLNTTYQLLDRKYTKKDVMFAKEVGLDLWRAQNFVKKFNYSELEKFVFVLEHFHFNVSHIFYSIDDIPIENFSQFAAYFFKSFLIYDNMDVRVCRAKGGYLENSLSKFLELYKDYLSLIEDEEHKDLYPENLSAAHDAAVDRGVLKKAEEEYKKYEVYETPFYEATLKYLDLEYCDKDFEVKVPRTPFDLIEESAVLHHCVKTYISSVALGKTRICLIRKNGVPYMTVEVKNSHIVQAKKKYNELPGSDDNKFLQKWCDCKNLKIVGY